MIEKIDLPKRDKEHERIIGMAFNMSPAQSSVLSCLARTPAVTSAQLLKYTGAKSGIKVVVRRVRTLIEPYNLVILSKQHVGYWMDKENRDRVETIVDAFLKGK